MMRDLWGDTLPQVGEDWDAWVASHPPLANIGQVYYGVGDQRSSRCWCLNVLIGGREPTIKSRLALETFLGRQLANVRR